MDSEVQAITEEQSNTNMRRVDKSEEAEAVLIEAQLFVATSLVFVAAASCDFLSSPSPMVANIFSLPSSVLSLQFLMSEIT